MKTKNKLLTIAAVLLLLLIMAGAGAFKPQNAVADVTGNAGLKLGGIKGKMPDNSAAVFFGSTVGQNLLSYNSYKDYDEVLCALRSGEINTVWATDLTADFLLRVNDDLTVFEPETMADIQKTEAPRFSFGMAIKNDDDGLKLKETIDKAIGQMKEDGALETLVYTYVENASAQELLPEDARFCPDDMKTVDGENLYVGVSGAAVPLEMLDSDSEPYGFCVALMDEIGSRTGRKVKFVVLDNETAFTSLMSGKVDLLFAYGSSLKTTENKQNYIMTEGYAEMKKYEFLTLKKG